MFSNIRLTTLAGCTTLAALGAGFTGQAYAQDYPYQDRVHPYVGASYGLYKSGDGDYDEDRDLWEVYAGLALHRYFGVEANWTNIGSMTSDFGDVDVDIDGWGLSVVGQLPLTDAFSIYGKIGQFFWDADVDVAGGSTSFDDDEPFFTIGAGFGVADPLTVTLEYTRFNAELELNELADNSDADDLDTVKAGLRFAF